MTALSVALVGLGPIGRAVAIALAGREGARVVAAADANPELAGRDLGDVLGVATLGVRVDATAAAAFARGARVAILCTGSRLARVAPDLEAAIDAGLHVVSTCEELALPEHGRPELARHLDERARARGVAVVGVGVNPGFVMDRLPLALAQMCVRVESARVERIVDAARRRGPLRAKVGAGLTVDAFRRGVAEGALGHVGLAESCALVARGLGLRYVRLVESLEPVLEPRVGVGEGLVAGLRQNASAVDGERVLVELRLEMSIAAPDPHDRVVLDADPPVDLRIDGGLHGDRATVGAVLNALPLAAALAPGLRTPLDLPQPGILL